MKTLADKTPPDNSTPCLCGGRVVLPSERRQLAIVELCPWGCGNPRAYQRPRAQWIGNVRELLERVDVEGGE